MDENRKAETQRFEDMNLPLDVEAINALSWTQGQGFWLREICIQLAALREELMNIRDKV